MSWKACNPSYLPSTVEDPGDVGRLEDLDLEDPEYNEKLDRLRKSRALIASGGGVKDLIQNTERGTGAIASIFLEAVEIGGAQEEPLSVRLAKSYDCSGCRWETFRKTIEKDVVRRILLLKM